MAAAGLCVIYLIAPTTPEDRIAQIVKRGTGFIYYVSREGVTGMQAKVSETIGPRTALIRRHTGLPIAVGFGISNPDQARLVAEHAEAIVVGSAVVNQIAARGQSPDLVPAVARFVQTLAEAIKPPP
jgi:tryptophan synthase alpha chain